MSNLATITNNILADSGIDDINVVVTNGSYANPAWITSLAWSKITGAPLGDYLPLVGGTMTGNINWAQTDRGLTWVFNTDGASIKFYNTGDGDTDSRLEFATLDNNNEYFRWGHIPSGGSFYESMRLVPNSSGNAQLIVSGSIIKQGGTSSQYLMADGSVSTLTNPITGSGTPNSLAKFTASNTIGDSAVTDNGSTIVLGRHTATLATASEANAITITQPAFTTDLPVKLLNFNWYDEPWSIGNIRSASIPSNGLGIFATYVEKVRFQTNAVVLQQGVNLQFRDNPFIRWSSNSLSFKNTDSSIPVFALRANGNNTQAPRLDMYNAADNAQTIVLNGASGTGVFNSSLVSTDYRYTQDGYLTYNTNAAATSTFTLRNNGTTVLGFNSSNKATFVDNVRATSLSLNTAEFSKGGRLSIVQGGANTNAIDIKNESWSTYSHWGTFANNTYFAQNYYYSSGQNNDDVAYGQAAIVLSTSTTAGQSNIDFNLSDPGSNNPTTKVRLFSTGNFLIGTITDAGYKLDVNGQIRSSSEIRNPYIVLRGDALEEYTTASDNGGVAINYVGYASGTSYFRNFTVFNGKGSQLFRIEGSTGTATFSASSLVSGNLQTNGVLTVGNQSAAGNYCLQITPSTTNRVSMQAILSGVGISDIVMQPSGGNVLIGATADNGAKLQVSGAVTAGVQSGYSYYANHTSAYSFLFSQINGANTIAFDNSAGILQVYTGNSLRLTISSTGAATFSSTLSSVGNLNTDSQLTVGGTGASLGVNIIPVINTAFPSSSVKSIIGSTNSGFGYAAGSLYLQPRTGVGAALVLGTEAAARLTIVSSGEAIFSSSVSTNGNVNVSNGSVFAGLGGPATSRGFYAGSSGFQASFLYNNSTGNLDISPRAGYNTIFTEGDVTTYGTLWVISGKNASARFYGEVGFDGGNRFYITNNAYIYGRNNLILTGRLDASNDGYSFGTNARNSLVFNSNDGGAQGSAGTEYMSIQLQLVTKALYIQTADNSVNGRAGTTFFQSGNVSFGSTSDTGYKFYVNGTGRFESSLAVGVDIFSGANLSVNSVARIGSAYTSQASIIFGDAGTPYWYVGRPASSSNFSISSYAINNILQLAPTTGVATFSSSVTATAFFESSDARLKSNIISLDIDASSIIAKHYTKNGIEEIGYLAQDVAEILPSAVSKREDGYLDLSYRQVHTAKIAYLEKRITELEQQLKNK